MSTKILLLLCVPTFLVSLVTHFVPWGLATAIVTLVAYGAVLFIPKKSWARVNAKTALEGLSYGDISVAEDHIEIALREAESTDKLVASDLEFLRDACERVATALIDSGQTDAGNSLRKRGEALTSNNPYRSGP